MGIIFWHKTYVILNRCNLLILIIIKSPRRFDLKNGNPHRELLLQLNDFYKSINNNSL